MAITINGTANTVAGLAVGGLPDGTVDNDTLATDAGKPADNSITGAKLAMGSDAQGDVMYYNGTDYIRLAKGSAGQVLTMNSGATAPEWATPDAGGITSAQQFRLAAVQAGSGSNGTVLTNWEESDTDYQGIGSVWSQSSGVFSTTTTGIYLCNWNMSTSSINVQDGFDPNVQISTDSGSSWSNRSHSYSMGDSSINAQSSNNHFIFDVANASTFRLRYNESDVNSVNSQTDIRGSSDSNWTCISFIRLGDT